MKKKVLVSAGALALAVGVTAAGTLAYLTDGTGKVTNTFTYNAELQDIELTLMEYKVNPDGVTIDSNRENAIPEGSEAQKYTVVPGATVDKKPFLVLDTENPSYLYVEIVTTGDSVIEKTNILDKGWTALGGATEGPHKGQVYYLSDAKTSNGTAEEDFVVFDKVTYNNIEQGTSLTANIDVYGYAIAQQGMGSVTEAWNTAKGDFTPKG